MANKGSNEQQEQGGGEAGSESSGLEDITRLKVGPVQYLANHTQRTVSVIAGEGQEELFLDKGEIQNLTEFFQKFQESGTQQ